MANTCPCRLEALYFESKEFKKTCRSKAHQLLCDLKKMVIKPTGVIFVTRNLLAIFRAGYLHALVGVIFRYDRARNLAMHDISSPPDKQIPFAAIWTNLKHQKLLRIRICEKSMRCMKQPDGAIHYYCRGIVACMLARPAREVTALPCRVLLASALWVSFPVEPVRAST